MPAILRELSTAATEIDRPLGPATDRMVEDVLEEIAKKLWPENTAACLASRIVGRNGKPIAVRTVERYFEGAREWSGDAVAVIISEIARRHGMRNVRVTARKT